MSQGSFKKTLILRDGNLAVARFTFETSQGVG